MIFLSPRQVCYIPVLYMENRNTVFVNICDNLRDFVPKLQALASMGVFHVLKIAQMVQNRATHHI